MPEGHHHADGHVHEGAGWKHFGRSMASTMAKYDIRHVTFQVEQRTLYQLGSEPPLT